MGCERPSFKSHTLDMFCPEEDRECRITGVCDLPLLRYEPPSKSPPPFKSHTLDMFCPEEDRESRITGVCDLPLLRYEPPSSRRFRVGGGRKTNARWSEGCEPKWHRRAVFSSIYASMLKHTASKYLYYSLLQSSKKETSAASTLFWPT